MEALQRAITATPDVVRDALAGVVALTTFAIAQGMRALVPRDKGLLLGNIGSSANGLTGRVEIGIDAYYWHFLEFGTVKMGAKPFIRPAAEAESNTFESRIVSVAKSIEQGFTEQDFARAA
jgi:HK97 gp10 family phage protein